MEVKAFRFACGDFIGVGDVEKEELERPGWALVPKGCRYVGQAPQIERVELPRFPSVAEEE